MGFRVATVLAAALACTGVARAAPLRVEAAIAPAVAGPEPVTGRLLVVISRDPSEEPRFQIDESYTSQQVFGADVVAGHGLVIDSAAHGYPLGRLADLPAGDYTVQAVFNRYEAFHRADGHVLWLPADRGEGQQWSRKPGNPMSRPARIHLSQDGGTVRLVLDQAIADIKPDADTPWLKHLHVRNERLSKFWGREVFLDADVLLPPGFAEHPDAHYPLVVYQDHFEPHFRAGGAAWRETPPDAGLKGAELARAEAGWRAYQAWTSGRLPKVILVSLNHANPFYDDSYAVNSANLGPYGDALNLDLVPEIEHRYRGVGQGWARAVFGGSTGGWETAATQVFYPDRYNGAWSACPDPVDFHAYQAANLYDDANAYVRTGPFGSIAIASDRAGDSAITAQMADVNHYELAIGSHGRSAEQYDAWQAVFSPVGPDGYPAAVYDKATGVVDKQVVAWWRDHYDLGFILNRDWAILGPKLEGKLHFAVGESDTYFLNNAVHLLQDSLDKTRTPHSDATFDYGSRAPHCFGGTVPDWAKAGHVDSIEVLLPQMADHMLATAPAGADVKSWRY